MRFSGRRQRARLLTTVALLMAVVGGEIRAETVEVEISKYKYHPAGVELKVGDTVRWVNRERRQYHSVKIHREGSTDPLIDSGYLFPEDRWEYTFADPGSYSYLCGPHPEMQGSIRVLP